MSKAQKPDMNIKLRYLDGARANLLHSMRLNPNGVLSHTCLAEVHVVAPCQHALLGVSRPLTSLALDHELARPEYQFGFGVRQYQRQHSSSDDGGLIHFRGLYRGNPWNSNFDYTRNWIHPPLQGTHFASFNGRYVPDAVLKEVYATVGAEMQWKQGRRGLELPDEAWAVLDAWTAKAS